MLHLKGFIVGVVTATAAAALWFLGRLLEPTAVELDPVLADAVDAVEQTAAVAAPVSPYAIFVVVAIGFAAGYAIVLGLDFLRRISQLAASTPPAKLPRRSQPAPPPVDLPPTGRGFSRRRRSKPLS